MTRGDPDRIVRDTAEELERKLRPIVASKCSEADFRGAIEALLDKFCGEVGVNALARREYTLATGRADAVFNRLVIEYEPPGKLGPYDYSASNKQPIQQVKDYILGVSTAKGHKLERLAGVVFDGRFLIFVRCVEKKFVVEPPAAVNRHSLERFLNWLSALSSGIALTAENLNRDFSIEQLRTQNILSALYKALNETLKADADGVVAKLFNQWRTFFSEAIDYSEAFGGRKLEPLRKWVRKAGLEVKTPNEAECFFFALHTYFALLVKFLAYLALSRHMGEKLGAPGFGRLAAMDSDTLRSHLKDLEEGGIFAKFGIKNLIEGSFFAWYTFAWNPKIEEAVRDLLKRLDEYDPTTLTLIPEETRDLFKKLYHYMLPREIRHNLGEYYTPDWLAQRLLNQVDNSFFLSDVSKREDWFRKNWNKLRFLDPACGSGTFLVLIIARLRQIGNALMIPESELLQTLQTNVVGFDLNPLAVLTARVNYLLAIADLLEHRKAEVAIPVYVADSIKTPAEGRDLFRAGKVEFDTAVGKFYLPVALCRQDRFDPFCEMLQESVRADIEADAFVHRVEAGLALSGKEWNSNDSLSLREFYAPILELHKQGMNGLWAQLLKNNFAPLTQGQFDCVVGNPPWVNWEHLPDEYREKTKHLWTRYQLAGTFHGNRPRLGAVKVDISALMTYVVTDTLLKPGGKLGFVITQSVFKTAGAGRGFRRFDIPGNHRSTPLKVLYVDDMVSLNPFEGASNRTSVIVLEKGRPTKYPVPYNLWRKIRGARFTYDNTLEEVTACTKRSQLGAEPVDPKDLLSPWLTARPKALRAIRKVLGKSDYKAHEGANTGGANAVYWVDIVMKRPDGLVVIRNITEGAKVKVEQVTETIEPDLLYPLLRGRDVQRWRAEPSAWMIVAQDTKQPNRAYPEKHLQVDFPMAYGYLKRFEKVLRERSGYKQILSKREKEFYGVMDIDKYTFSPWKVVWTRVANIEAAVAGPGTGKAAVPQETVVLVAAADSPEAHFIAAVVNSSAFQFVAHSFGQEGGKSMGTPHILEHIRIPRFEPKSAIHARLAELSQKAHEAAAKEDLKTLRQIEAEIDRVAAKLWGLTDAELKEIQQNLAELSSPPGP